MVVFEIGFAKVAVQVSLADVVELAVNGALEQRKKAFNRIRVMEPASADILVSRVVDRAVTGKLA